MTCTACASTGRYRPRVPAPVREVGAGAAAFGRWSVFELLPNRADFERTGCGPPDVVEGGSEHGDRCVGGPDVCFGREDGVRLDEVETGRHLPRMPRTAYRRHHS
ncbi:hypothetical protein ACU686_12980 [Yinghuangia aomiensis]